jgi:prepilin-type N-terminal cleavage/methylation domain-containing protein
MKSDKRRVTNDESMGDKREIHTCHPSLITHHFAAFTLVELLAVITIIGVIAALLVPTLGAVKRKELINKTQAEMAQIETALERYKAAYGFYPPDNPNSPIYNALYFELLGTTNNGGTYQTLDDSANIGSGNLVTGFGINGFINCSKPNTDESTPPARNFLPDLKPDQFSSNYTNNNIQVTLLISSASGIPWRYVSPGTNNPNSYDLWTQIIIKNGQTNFICNWSRQPLINSSLP